MAGRVEHSVSTWRQPVPPPPSGGRRAVVGHVVARAMGARRVAIDGRTGAGKTSFGHEVAVGLADAGRVVLRASLDDFKRPWREAHLYDRESGEGYYRNAFDLDAIRRLLDATGPVALCSIDPITQVDHSAVLVDLPEEGVLVVDGVFAFRPELDDRWDLRIWLDVDAEVSVRRGIARDGEASAPVHRQRYLAAEEVYLAEVDPAARADVVIDNTDIDAPVLRRG